MARRDLSSLARTFAVIIALMVLLPLAAPTALGAVTDDSDPATWVSEPVPGTPFTVKRPAGWVVNPAALSESMDDQPGDIHLVIANPETGDNVIFNAFEGENGAWYPHFTDFERQALASADSSDGKLLATGKRHIKGMPVYWSLETYTDPSVGVPVYYVEFEVRTGRDSVLTAAMNVNKDTPHARRLVMNLIKNIGAQ